MNPRDMFFATHQGTRGCVWHIFKKTGSYNRDAESLCRQIREENLSRNHTRKEFEPVDEAPGLGHMCQSCKKAVDARLRQRKEVVEKR